MKALSTDTVQVYIAFLRTNFTLNKGNISLKIIINRTILPVSNGVNKPQANIDDVMFVFVCR